jgi:ATP-dependent helicase/nuclease subunit A
MTFTVADQAERERARTSRGESLVLEAGAGTGKTTLLVDRIESLLRSGDATVTDLAAVTFTENAAATMKLRLRERLERVRASEAPEEERARAARALESLERAQVSTIHAFCQAILQERPLECGVAPAFRVIDESQAEALFTESWDEWLIERLDEADPVLAEAVRAGIPLVGYRGMGEATSLRGLARTLLWERDLEPVVAAARPDPEAWRAELEASAGRSAEARAASIAGDLLHDDLVQLEEFAASCATLRGPALRDRLLALPRLKPDRGRRGNWRSTEALTAGRDLARWTVEAAERWRQEAGCGLHAELVGSLQGVLRRYEEKKRREGVLDFVDLLVKARDGLRDRPGVRHHVRQRFTHLLIDEFQDTDPLQVQVVRAIAGDDPGRLVVVGDAKQSIYRFRRADVALFRRLSAEARERAGHSVLHLVQSFRARPGLLRFANRAFAELISESGEADQPAYEPIVPPPGLEEGPAVISLRFEAPALAAGDELLDVEAEALAAFIAEAARGGQTVRDPDSGESRPSRAGDVMVLAPRLTQIRYLEDALDLFGIPFAVDGGKSFFNRQEVHEALATLKAVDDPSDRASLVAALRSCFFGLSDRDIVSYALSHGRLEVGAEGETSLPGGTAVAPALELLTRLHRERLRISVPSLLERLYDETRALAALTGTRRGEARIANLEKVAALARQAHGVGVLTLRGFTRLLAARMQDSSEEPDLPAARPEDPSTVRILSIHKAKGLEAPIVALHDLAASLVTRPSVIALWDEGKVAVGFRQGCRPPDWNALAQRDEVKARAEGRRLLYVACTRARDLLVMPRPPADAQPGDFWRDLLPYLDRAAADEVRVVDARTLPAPGRAREGLDRSALATAEGGDAVAARWQQRRSALLADGARRPLAPMPVVRAAARTAPPPASAPARTAGDTGAVLIDPAARGRGFGSLVHRILEWIPLDDSSPAAVAAMATALAPGFGLGPEAAARAAETASRVLALPLLDRARAARRVYRELLVWFPEGEELLEGVVDLVFEEEARGLVVVDYKTDHITPEQAVAQAAHHAPQLQLYGRGLAQATGLPVAERLVLFTALGHVVEV